MTGQCHLCRADALGNQSSGPRAESQPVDGSALKRCLKGTEIFLLVLSLVLFGSSHQLSSIHEGCSRCWGSTRRPSYCFTQSHKDSKPASFIGERVFSCLTLTQACQHTPILAGPCVGTGASPNRTLALRSTDSPIRRTLFIARGLIPCLFRNFQRTPGIAAVNQQVNNCVPRKPLSRTPFR